MARIMGRAYVRVDGETIATTSGSIKLTLGGITRTPVLGDFGPLGFTEATTAATVEFNMAVTEDTDLVSLNNVTDASVIVEVDSGQTFTVKHAYVTEPIEVSPTDGYVTVKFSGDPAVQG